MCLVLFAPGMGEFEKQGGGRGSGVGGLVRLIDCSGIRVYSILEFSDYLYECMCVGSCL